MDAINICFKTHVPEIPCDCGRNASTASTSSRSLGARMNALDDFGRKSVLHYLIGFAPEAVREALDEVESQEAIVERRTAE